MAELEASGTSARALIGAVALSVSVILVALAALLLGANIHRLRDSFAWVEHTNNVMLEAAGVHESLLEAGSATRSYLITGDTSYITAHDRARAAVDARLAVLRSLVADNAGQSKRAAELQALIGTREARFDRTGGLTPAARTMLISGMRGAGTARAFHDFTLQIGTRFDAFRRAEIALLQARQERAQSAEGFTLFLAFITAALALLCGGVGIFFIQRERAEHRARELELVLTHTQRLTLMGETSLALAHELNQPLSAAGNYLSALKRFLASETTGSLDQADDTAEKARAQVQRAGEIVKRLRNFVALGENERSPQHVEVLFADALALLGTLDDTVSLKRVVEPGLPPVFVDRIQIQQVLVNLMRNSIEAMRNSPSRELTLTAVRRDHDTVQISLRDTGSGLAPDVAARLFRPFVTTKSNGMGVGLSICQRIVLEHGGRIWAESVPGAGARFSFTLPAARTSGEVAAA